MPDTPGGPAAAIDPKMLELLVEPGTLAPLRYDRARQLLIAEASGLAYPIRDGVPIMLAEEAIPLDQIAEDGKPA